MSTLGIITSPRKDGNTTYLLSKTLEYGKEEKEAIRSSERIGNQLLKLIKKMEEKKNEEPIGAAKSYSKKVIVVYGDTCYLPKELDELIQEEDREITRIEADYPWTQINL